MKIKLNQKQFAGLDIVPTLDLLSTVNILAEILGGLEFEKDDGFYEEYPAYIARDSDSEFEIALLGIPDPKYEIRAHPSPYYDLRIEPIDAGDDAYTVDASKEFAALINADGRIKALERPE